MWEGVVLGVFAGTIIYIISRREQPRRQVATTPIDSTLVTSMINTPSPAEVPPPNIDGCIIPQEEGYEFKLIESTATECKWSKKRIFNGLGDPTDPNNPYANDQINPTFVLVTGELG